VPDKPQRLTREALIGQQLRRIRNGRGWTQQDVADRMRPYGHNWIKSTVNRIETGKRPLRVNELDDLAAMLGVQMALLLAPLPNGVPTDIDLQTATAEELKAAIEKRAAERSAVGQEELSAKTELEQAPANERLRQARERLVIIDRELALLRNQLVVAQAADAQDPQS
jgi:transcriptional regulator with XRE-family HTH domain